ncbi:TPA: AAA family ATPase [Candidatus Scatousia excrementigallinarum]|uniref:AAA family ATPase n=1 Tax=Candidatus Scatousia excrementigallinarum TaxID=2840935 RepID=A0A9D1F1E3_9BACT|nr:AAA family ATPase [Candidatus Scatousia excrementigallinarum]
MELSEHVQYIIHSAKTIVYARDYNAVEPEHIMLALFMDENDLPKIILEKIGLDNPRLIRDFSANIPKRNGHKPQRSQDPPLSKNTITLIETAEKEGLVYGDRVVSIEHLFLALFKTQCAVMDYVFKQYSINQKELYGRMKDVIDGMTTVDIVDGKVVEPASKPQTVGSQTDVKKDANKEENPLEKYTTDLTAVAAQSKLDPVIGRDDEIRRVIQILNRRSKNNPVIVGEPGVGKTAVIEGLAQRIIKGDVPESLKNDKILSLDLGALLAGASYRGEFEERLKSVLKAIEEKTDDLMLFIDEIHTIMGMGGSDGSVDAGNLLKPMLARGMIRVIGATTLDEYKKYIEKDKALERRFQPVIVDEPSVETTISILRGLKNKYEVFHGIKILDEAIVQAVKLSHRYIPDRFLPDKAIDLIDEAASSLRINIDTMPEDIDIFTREKFQLEIERNTLQEEKSKEADNKIVRINKKIDTLEQKINKLRDQWQQEKKVINSATTVKKNLEILKSQLEIAQKKGQVTTTLEEKYKQMLSMEQKLKELQSDKSKKHLIKEYLDGDDISNIVAKWTGIPTTRLVEDESKKLLQMENFIHERLIGQEEAVNKIANAIRLSRSGLRDNKRPIGSFLFLGPTGVGKTELGKTLAEFLFNDEDALVRIDMSEFMEKSAISRLTGATAGYVGYEEGGQLTEAVRRKPYSVVLFDEIEKAHPDIFNIMLQMFDDGRLTDGQGKLVDFKNTVLIMTSNLGSEILLDNKLSNQEKYDNVHALLRSKFKPEFINRIDEIITFSPLSLAELARIVEIQTSSLKKRVEEQGMELEITENAKVYLANEGYEPLYGARPLRRVIRQAVEIPLSMKILANEFVHGDKIVIDCVNDELVFNKAAISV